VAHVLFGNEVEDFLEYHRLLDFWKKIAYQNVIENTEINSTIQHNIITFKDMFLSTGVVLTLVSVGQAVFLDMIHIPHSFGN